MKNYPPFEDEAHFIVMPPRDFILREALQYIATTPSAEECCRFLLKLLVDTTGASGGCVVLFAGDLRITNGLGDAWLPEMQLLNDSLADLPKSGISEWYIAGNIPLKRVLSAPLYVERDLIGGMWLLFEDDVEFSSDTQSLSEALVNGLTIVAARVRASEQFRRLSHNQMDFTRIVAHDLRSPLTSVQGFGSMLLMSQIGELNERQQTFVERILSGVTQMTALVDNIQDAGRFDPETGFYEIERVPVDLQEMIARLAESYLVPAEKGALTLQVLVDDQLPIVIADANMLERAITNLLDNAIKYTPNGGNVDVGAQLKNNEVVIFVRDSGLGISPENQQRLFQRHVRLARQEHKRVKGSGLGLFIVRSVAQHHGGDAWVESVEGQGSTFAFNIPLSDMNGKAQENL